MMIQKLQYLSIALCLFVLGCSSGNSDNSDNSNSGATVQTLSGSSGHSLDTDLSSLNKLPGTDAIVKNADFCEDEEVLSESRSVVPAAVATGVGTIHSVSDNLSINAVSIGNDEIYLHNGELRVLVLECDLRSNVSNAYGLTSWEISNASAVMLIETFSVSSELLNGGTFTLAEDSEDGLLYAVLAYDIDNNGIVEENEGEIMESGFLTVSGSAPDLQFEFNFTSGTGASFQGSYQGDYRLKSAQQTQ